MKLTKKFRKMAAVLLTTLMVVMMLMAVPFTASAAEDTDTVVYPGDKVTITYSFAKDIPEGCAYYCFESNYPFKMVKYSGFKNHWVFQVRIDEASEYYYKRIPVQGMTTDSSHYGPQVKAGQKIISIVYDVIKKTKMSDLDFSLIDLKLGVNNQYDYLRDFSYLSYNVEIEKSSEPTTVAPTTTEPTTVAPTTEEPTTEEPTEAPTTVEPTEAPTTVPPTTVEPTEAPTTVEPTTVEPTTVEPTETPTTEEPTTVPPTTVEPTTEEPTEAPTTEAPTTVEPTTVEPTEAPTTVPVTTQPITEAPTVTQPTTNVPVVTQPATVAPSTEPTQPATKEKEDTTPTTTVAPAIATATPDEPSNGGNGSNDNGIVKTGQNMPAMIPVSIITMALTFAVMRFCRRKRSK